MDEAHHLEASRSCKQLKRALQATLLRDSVTVAGVEEIDRGEIAHSLVELPQGDRSWRRSPMRAVDEAPHRSRAPPRWSTVLRPRFDAHAIAGATARGAHLSRGERGERYARRRSTIRHRRSAKLVDLEDLNDCKTHFRKDALLKGSKNAEGDVRSGRFASSDLDLTACVLPRAKPRGRSEGLAGPRHTDTDASSGSSLFVDTTSNNGAPSRGGPVTR